MPTDNLLANIKRVLSTQELKGGADRCMDTIVKSYVSRPDRAVEILAILVEAKDKVAALGLALECLHGCRSDPARYSDCAGAARKFLASTAGTAVSDPGFLDSSRRFDSALEDIEATVAGKRIPKAIRPYLSWPVLLMGLLGCTALGVILLIFTHLHDRKVHTREIDGMKAGHSREIDGMKAGHSREIDGMKAGHSREIDEMNMGHSREVDAIRKDYALRLDELGHSAQLEAARAALKQFTPPPPPLRRPNIEVAARFHQGVGVHGDFFNWYTTNDGDTWIYLVDVEGRGFRAAITSALIRHVMDSTVETAENDDPRKVLTVVDRQFERYGTTRDLAATMNLIRVSTSNESLELANAGMPAPLIFRYGQAQAVPIQAAGVYVGSGYSHYKIEPALAKEDVGIGDLIVAYSDGVIEARNGTGNPWGVGGLSSQVMRYRDADVDEIATRIIEGATDHAGTEAATDDECVVVIRVGSNTEGRRERSAPTIDVSWTTIGDDPQVEFTIVHSVDAVSGICSTLRSNATDWTNKVAWGGDPVRFWLGLFEAIVNSLRHATGMGDRVRVRLYKQGSDVVAELDQPREWRDWDMSLGPERRALVEGAERLDPSMPQWGTLLMLWFSDSLEVLRQGRLIRMRFSPQWRKEGKCPQTSQ
jgi:serine phosphatase RsbU (regulator of sigma subunit)